MISATSTTDRYILQPSLMEKHEKTVEWLSTCALWKREFSLFQKLLDRYAAAATSTPDKKTLGHLQDIILYYRGEVLDGAAAKLRGHEKKLADILSTRNEADTSYFKEHDQLIGEIESLHKQVVKYKEELYAYVEKLM